MRYVRRERSNSNSLNYDTSISDLMSALVLIFILLLSTQLLELKKQSSIAEDIVKTRIKILAALQEEFPADQLKAWGAEIDPKELSVRFKGEETSFLPESDILRPQFKQTLDDFFPRFINVLTREEFKNEIDEIRIEGHTANPNDKFSEKTGYFDSIRLSQRRANNVLYYVTEKLFLANQEIAGLPKNAQKTELSWVQKHISASGFGFARPYPNEENPDWISSRRVEFKVRVKSEEALENILSITEGNTK
jgi:outer membrane protein OmpA-like peptidoglycan-associated protein